MNDLSAKQDICEIISIFSQSVPETPLPCSPLRRFSAAAFVLRFQSGKACDLYGSDSGRQGRGRRPHRTAQGRRAAPQGPRRFALPRHRAHGRTRRRPGLRARGDEARRGRGTGSETVRAARRSPAGRTAGSHRPDQRRRLDPRLSDLHAAAEAHRRGRRARGAGSRKRRGRHHRRVAGRRLFRQTDRLSARWR